MKKAPWKSGNFRIESLGYSGVTSTSNTHVRWMILFCGLLADPWRHNPPSGGDDKCMVTEYGLEVMKYFAGLCRSDGRAIQVVLGKA